MAALAWIPIYAIVTVHKSGWLTRQIRPQSAARRPWLQVARLAPAYAAAGLLAMLLGSGATLKMTSLPLSDLPQMAALSEQGQVQGQAVAFTHTEDGVARWRLAATGSSLDRMSGVVSLRGVEVVFFTKNGQEVRLSGDEAEFDPSDQSLALEGNVRGTTFNGLRLATNSLVYYDDERLVQTDDEVILSGPSFRMRGHGFSIDMAKSRTVLRKPITSRVSAMNQAPTRLAYLGS